MHAIVTLLKIMPISKASEAIEELDKETRTVLSADYKFKEHSFRCENPFLTYAKNTSVQDSVTIRDSNEQIIILRKITTHDQP